MPNAENLVQPLVRHSNPSLWSLLAAFLFASAAALNCSIDLSQFVIPATAQCENGCDSCTFWLATGTFALSAIHCLAAVPCLVHVNSTDFLAMRGTIVNGTIASALTLHTANGRSVWIGSVIHAPRNGGNFLFESSSPIAVSETMIFANDSGVVRFKFQFGGSENIYYPELQSISIMASTAKALEIVMEEGTRFARGYASHIECPLSGACKWKSKGKRYDYIAEYIVSVNLIASVTTDLELVCNKNADSCAGVYVLGNAQSCEMQYNVTVEDTWQCIGTLSLAKGVIETVDFTTASTYIPSTSSTLRPASTHLPTTTEKDSGNKSKSGALLYAAIGVSLALFCCVVAAAIGYFAGVKLLPKARISELPKVVASVSVDADNNALELGKQLGEGIADNNPTAPRQGDDCEELKDALHKVDKMQRDHCDEKFGAELASISAGNLILEEDVRDQMDGVQPTRGEGVAQTSGLRLTEVLIAAQPEGGDEAIIDEHI